MLRSNEWEKWIAGQHRCLWIYGMPGAGKTILTSHLIEAVMKHCKSISSTLGKCAFVYYYCYFGHSQDEASPLLKWIINQLCRQDEAVPPCLHNLYKSGGEPSLVDLLRSLESISKEFGRVYIVVDAIDESMPRDDLLKVLRDLATDVRFQNIQVLATSRQYLDIEKAMLEISAPVSMRNPLLDADIRLFVKAQLRRHPKLKSWPTHLKDRVLEALSEGAKGM